MKNPIQKIKSALRPESASQGDETRSDAAGLEKHLSTLPPEARLLDRGDAVKNPPKQFSSVAAALRQTIKELATRKLIEAPGRNLDTPEEIQNFSDEIAGPIDAALEENTEGIADLVAYGVFPLPKERHDWVELLRQQIKEVASAEKEIETNEFRKAEAAKDLKLSATPGLTVAESRSKIIDARVAIDFCDGKDHGLIEALTAAKESLLETTREAAVRFNTYVYRARDIEEGKIKEQQRKTFGIEGASEFWNQGGRAAAETMLARFFPCEFPRIHFTRQPGNLTWSEKNIARILIAHIERHAAGVDVDPKAF